MSNIELVPVWRVQVWKRKHIVEAELFDTYEEAERKAVSFRETYPKDEYKIKVEKDFLKIAKSFTHSIFPHIPPIA